MARNIKFGNTTANQLTERELLILQHVADGDTDAEIAEALGLSLRTVKTHIQNMRAKTGFRNRTQLAVKAAVAGLVKVE